MRAKFFAEIADNTLARSAEGVSSAPLASGVRMSPPRSTVHAVAATRAASSQLREISAVALDYRRTPFECRSVVYGCRVNVVAGAVATLRGQSLCMQSELHLESLDWPAELCTPLFSSLLLLFLPPASASSIENFRSRAHSLTGCCCTDRKHEP